MKSSADSAPIQDRLIKKGVGGGDTCLIGGKKIGRFRNSGGFS